MIGILWDNDHACAHKATDGLAGIGVLLYFHSKLFAVEYGIYVAAVVAIRCVIHYNIVAGNGAHKLGKRIGAAVEAEHIRLGLEEYIYGIHEGWFCIAVIVANEGANKPVRLLELALSAFVACFAAAETFRTVTAIATLEVGTGILFAGSIGYSGGNGQEGSRAKKYRFPKTH